MNELEKFASKIIPKGKSRDWHNALMDYGALELTARKTKIKPTSKQSKFEWSDRQVRGNALKRIIENWKLKMEDLQADFPHKDVKQILQGMKEESLIHIKKWVVTIAE